jgi:hypothetical protein
MMAGATRAKEKSTKAGESSAAEGSLGEEKTPVPDKDTLLREAIDLISHIQHHNDFTRGWLERAHKALGE